MGLDLEENMKHKRWIILVGLILVVMGITVSLCYTKIAAQQEVVGYLKERLEKENIPVLEIKVLGTSPYLRLMIIVQNVNVEETGKAIDPIVRHSIQREVILARQHGYVIDSFVLVILNHQGEQIFLAEMPGYSENVPLQISPAKLDDRATRDIALKNLTLYGLSLVEARVVTSEGIQTLTLQLSTPSLETANQSLPEFMLSLRPFIADINAQGAQIVICRIELRDAKGQLLLKYVLDLQLDSEIWWQIDGLTEAWFPSPPSEADLMTSYPDYFQTEAPTKLQTDTITIEPPAITPAPPLTNTPPNTQTETPICAPFETPTAIPADTLTQTAISAP